MIGAERLFPTELPVVSAPVRIGSVWQSPGGRSEPSQSVAAEHRVVDTWTERAQPECGDLRDPVGRLRYEGGGW